MKRKVIVPMLLPKDKSVIKLRPDGHVDLSFDTEPMTDKEYEEDMAKYREAEEFKKKWIEEKKPQEVNPGAF